MKKAILVLLVLGALAGGGLGVRAWRAHVARQQENRAFLRAERFIQQQHPIEALAIQQHYASLPGARPDWARIEFGALVAQLNLPRLTAIFQEDPDRLLASEDGSLTVARSCLHLRQQEEFERIRSAWRGRETDPARWTLLDVDRLLLDGQAGKARELLEAIRFPGTNDAPRLLRLALIAASQKPAESAELLNAAVALAPHQPDGRAFRGQVLEALNRPAEARVEYVAAVVAAPGNPIWRDQLAEFYRRQGNLDLALATWREGLPAPSLDAIWLKAAFWGRMLQPIDFRSISNPPPAGRLASIVALLQAEPAGGFLNTNALAHLPFADRLILERQELFWLQLAEALKRGDEDRAASLLRSGRADRRSWQPELERALLRMLAFRKTRGRSLEPVGIEFPGPAPSEPQLHTFFAALEIAASSPRNDAAPLVVPNLAKLLTGEHAFAAAFLAAGWREAALNVADPATVDTGSPDWLAYGLAQALRYNRSPEAALEFLARFPKEPSLDLLTAEIRLSLGQREPGLSGLRTLAALDSAAGYRAAWLLARDALDHGESADARRWVGAHPRLAGSVTGEEILARVLLAEGDTNAAAALYARLAPRSMDARAFLARAAFARQDWPEARRWTEELLALIPDSVELRADLEAIARAETQATP